jgi:hypothetical protein
MVLGLNDVVWELIKVKNCILLRFGHLNNVLIMGRRAFNMGNWEIWLILEFIEKFLSQIISYLIPKSKININGQKIFVTKLGFQPSFYFKLIFYLY